MSEKRIVTGQEIIDWVNGLGDDEIVNRPEGAYQSEACLVSAYAEQVLGFVNPSSNPGAVYEAEAAFAIAGGRGYPLDREGSTLMDSFDNCFGAAGRKITAAELRAALPQFFGG